MALTDDELALLSTLAYLEKSDVLDNGLIDNFWNGAYENQDVTLGDVLDKVADDSVIADLRSEGKRDQKDSLRITGAEWADALEAARGNESIRNLSYVDVDSFAEDGSRAFCFASGDQAYVVYRGTGSDPASGGSEWADNFDGLWQSDTHAQRAALNYAEYAHALTGLDVTVTGHSKGGNKAMYAAVRSPHVARCVSFDGQGFGTAFLARHGALVAKRAGVISAYNLDGDFVSPLLRPIAGKMVWLNGSRANGDLLKNHSPIALFGESAALASGADRGALSVQVGRFSDFLLHAVPEGQLRPLADLLGDAASIALGGVEGDLLSVVAGNPEGLGTLVALLMSYPGTDDLLGAVEDEAVPGSDLLLDVLGALGLGPRSPLARQAGGFALAGMDAAFLGMLLSEALGLDAGWAGAFARSYAAGRAGIKPGAGPLAGALSPGGSAVVRDFSDEARAELRSIAQEVAAEPWFDPSTWDAWYRAEAWFGRLTIDNYQHDLASYFRKVVDVNDASAQDIDRIFDRAVERDAAFARSLSDTPARLASAARALDAVLG